MSRRRCLKERRKTNEQFFISCEGECEKFYFEHLQKLINTCEKRKANCKIYAKKKQPKDLVLGFGLAKLDLPFMSARDIEDNSPYHVKLFHEYLDEIKYCTTVLKAKTFIAGYSNFAFELWIILHRKVFDFQILDRTKYLSHINSSFGFSFSTMDEYKKEDNFKSLLETISLEDVKKAIENARSSRKTKKSACKIVKYSDFEYDSVDPATNIDSLVSFILDKCL